MEGRGISNGDTKGRSSSSLARDESERVLESRSVIDSPLDRSALGSALVELWLDGRDVIRLISSKNTFKMRIFVVKETRRRD